MAQINFMGRGSIDMINLSFGNFKVLNESLKKSNKGEAMWDCICSCGQVVSIKGTDIRRGRVNFCSTCKELKSKDSPILTLYNNYKNNAIYRGYNFELSFNKFKELISHRCYYCGIEPKQFLKKKGAKFGVIYNGIDRMNNFESYTIENSVSCCKFCNLGKNRFTKEEFMNWIQHIKKI